MQSVADRVAQEYQLSTGNVCFGSEAAGRGPACGVAAIVRSGRSGSQLFRYPCGSVAPIQRKTVAAISKI